VKVTGRVIDIAGRPFRFGVPVSVTSPGPSDERRRITVRTAQDGRFSFGAAPSRTYKLEAEDGFKLSLDRVDSRTGNEIDLGDIVWQPAIPVELTLDQIVARP
jgi:hypothetical protein